MLVLVGGGGDGGGGIAGCCCCCCCCCCCSEEVLRAMRKNPEYSLKVGVRLLDLRARTAIDKQPKV